MKFKGNKQWRELEHTDAYGDSIAVSVSRSKDDTRVYISAQTSVSMSVEQTRALIKKLTKELDRK